MKFSDVIERLEKLGEKREVKSQLHNIRLGQKDPETNLNEEDATLQDEEITSRVMNMMANLNESDEETTTQPRINTIMDDDEDNELISQLLSTNQI
ncbi:unnamed protein product [Brachionus calyciflorus]|uniref:Uncharacterized protein n=1 Tax=Brachionus calyciflorus TaxID=104777 RepID=A0A814DCM0_9BILA|nr:unnamed protein product [Brachionus calyciflorus]